MILGLGEVSVDLVGQEYPAGKVRGSRKMAGKHVETFALKLGKNARKVETFCGALETVVMCLVGVGKCMGVEFGKIGSAPRVLGPSGTPKKARFWSSSNGENYRQIVARAVGWS